MLSCQLKTQSFSAEPAAEMINPEESAEQPVETPEIESASEQEVIAPEQEQAIEMPEVSVIDNPVAVVEETDAVAAEPAAMLNPSNPHLQKQQYFLSRQLRSSP